MGVTNDKITWLWAILGLRRAHSWILVYFNLFWYISPPPFPQKTQSLPNFSITGHSRPPTFLCGHWNIFAPHSNRPRTTPGMREWFSWLLDLFSLVVEIFEQKLCYISYRFVGRCLPDLFCLYWCVFLCKFLSVQMFTIANYVLTNYLEPKQLSVSHCMNFLFFGKQICSMCTL